MIMPLFSSPTKTHFESETASGATYGRDTFQKIQGLRNEVYVVQVVFTRILDEFCDFMD